MPGWGETVHNRTIGSTSTPPDTVVLMAIWWWWNEVLTPEELLRGAEDLGPAAFAADISDSSVGAVLNRHLNLEEACKASIKGNPTWEWVTRFPGIDSCWEMFVRPTVTAMAAAMAQVQPVVGPESGRDEAEEEGAQEGEGRPWLLTGARGLSRLPRTGGGHMGLHDCRIKIRGDGRGGHGRYVHDHERPVWEFIVDNTKTYARVREHIRSCTSPNRCDPGEALKRYLGRRLEMRKFNGTTSSSLARLARSYRVEFGDRVDLGTVKEIIYRSMALDILYSNLDILGMDGLIDGVYRMEAMSDGRMAPYLDKSRFRGLVNPSRLAIDPDAHEVIIYSHSQMIRNKRLPESRESLLNIVRVAGIMEA
jgi:hypothetical protein